MTRVIRPNAMPRRSCPLKAGKDEARASFDCCFEFEEGELHRQQLKELMWEEMRRYHPEQGPWKKEPPSDRSQSSPTTETPSTVASRWVGPPVASRGENIVGGRGLASHALAPLWAGLVYGVDEKEIQRWVVRIPLASPGMSLASVRDSCAPRCAIRCIVPPGRLAGLLRLSDLADCLSRCRESSAVNSITP